MDVCTYVGTVDDVMAIKPNFLALMGYQYFLSYGAWRAQSYAIISALKTSQLLASFEYSIFRVQRKIADLLNKKEF